MNKKSILEYIRTIIIGLITSLFLAGVATGCSKVIAEHHAKMLAKMVNNARDNEMIVHLIDVYKEKAKEDPGDYNINVRLGNLYELIFNYAEAEKQYNNAIGKAPYGVYSPYFGLASVYVKEKKYQKAHNIVKKLENKDYKPLLVAKGDFYMTLGDALWQESEIKDALRQYKLAFFYYKKVDSKKKEIAIDGIVDCYDKMANDDYKKHQYKKAVEHLETSLLYRENPFVYYKLAILYKDFDPIQANKYIEKTLQKALVLAEKTAEDTKQLAQKEAKRIEKEAQLKYQIVLGDAKNELNKIHKQTVKLMQQYLTYLVQSEKQMRAVQQLFAAFEENIVYFTH